MYNKISSPINSTDFNLSLNAKEAIKVGIAFILTYAIALHSGWLNPYWAGFAVSMVSLAPPGLSLKKGLLRATGTLPGCLAAVIIVAIAPQNKWLFLILCCAFIFFTSYMMIIDQDKPYFWNVIGFTSLTIAVTAISGDMNNFFQLAVMRTIETFLGVIIYSLVTLFIWPQRNTGAIKRAYLKLIHSQRLMLVNCQDIIDGKSSRLSPIKFSNQQAKLLEHLTDTIQAESFENIKIFNNRHLLKCLKDICTTQMDNMQKWHLSVSILSHIDLNTIIPNLNKQITQCLQLFDEINDIVIHKKIKTEIRDIPLIADPKILETLTHYDRAAISLTIQELTEIHNNLKHTITYLKGIKGILPPKQIESYPSRSLWQKVSRPTRASLRRTFFTTIVMVISFITWVYIDTPGHGYFFLMATIFATMVTNNQQVSLTEIIKTFIITIPICLCVYIFILPKFTLFSELAVVFFILIAATSYFFSGMSKAIAFIAIINIVSFNNIQQYDIAAIFNKSVFLIMSVALTYILSYLFLYPLPEKKIQNRVKYFFKKAHWLSENALSLPRNSNNCLFRYRVSLNLNEIKTLPHDIRSWTNAIDYNIFNHTTEQQTKDLIIALQTLSYRIEQLHQFDSVFSHNQELNKHLNKFKKFIMEPLLLWSLKPDAGNEEFMRQRLKNIEYLTTKMVQKIDNSISEEETKSILLLIASYRGIAEASINYLHVAKTIDWAQWQQERFS